MTGDTDTHCLFCQIVAGTRPARLVYQDSQVTAFRDINPQAPTHILVVPNRHLVSLSEAKEGDTPLMGVMLARAAEIARQEGLAGYRVVLNNGAEAGQSVWHLHLHLLGGRRMTWPPG